jgi:hypothetical protein
LHIDTRVAQDLDPGTSVALIRVEHRHDNVSHTTSDQLART